MMSLPELSIRRPVFAWMLMVAIILFGVISFFRLGISQLPDVDFPVVSISLTLSGAAPEVVESQVLDPIEDAIMEIDGIRSVTSSAQQSSGTIAVEFELTRDIDLAMQEIQNKINQVSNLMPVNLRPPTLRKSNPEDQPILWLAVTSDDPNEKPIDLMIFTRNYLYDQFAVLPGVGNIALGGYVDPALRIWVDQDKLNKFEMTSDELLASVAAGHQELPAGLIQNSKTEQNVRVMGEAMSPEDFKKISIDSRATLGANYRHTTLSEVATIEQGVQDVRKFARFNGKRTAALGLLKQHGANAVDVAKGVRAKLKELEHTMPKKYHVDIRSDSTRFIKQSVDELIFTLSLSALLTALVCYLFLGSWTSTMNVLMSIPTSIVGAFTAFYFLNYTLNTFTLLGLSLAIGIVVDDAIMMLENIVRHRELGESRKNAALKGANEITFAAIAATLAVVAIFMPVVFMKGVIGKYFLQYGITVTVAILLSLLEALTLTPMRCSRYLDVNLHPTGLVGSVDRLFVKMSARFQQVLGVLLNHRAIVLVVTSLIFISSLFLATKLPSEMMPAQDQAMFLIRVKLPVGTSLWVTNERVTQIENYLRSHKEVDGVFAAVGGFNADAVNQAVISVTLVDADKRKLTQTQLINKFRTELKAMAGSQRGIDPSAALATHEATATHSTDGASAPSLAKAAAAGAPKSGADSKNKKSGMQINIQDLSLRGFAATRGFPVEFIIQGPNWDQLSDVSTKVMAAMRKSGLMTDVNTDVQPGMPEAQLIPNRAKLAAHGVSLGTVTNVVNALIGGQIWENETQYSIGRHRYQIELRLNPEQRESVPSLDKIKVRNTHGEMVALSEVVDVQVRPSLMLISRLNRARAITIYANPTPGVSQNEALIGAERIAKSMLPQGYTLKMTGSSQSFRESRNSLLWAMLLGLVVSYMVLASQFDSFIHPVTVLMALPFSLSGAFVGLLLFHQSMNIFSMIGLILLMGIVKKNSILLVDFTNQMRAEGMNVRDALLKACPVRLRPILMTSVATIAGALPEALSIGPGAETTVPMAVSIIGGVLASTVLTLFVVPVVYSCFAHFESKREPFDLPAAHPNHDLDSVSPIGG